MHTKQDWLRAICENPADDTLRLVYADWLEENGEAARAEFIRYQIREPDYLHQFGPYSPMRGRIRCLKGELPKVLSQQIQWLGARYIRGFLYSIRLECCTGEFEDVCDELFLTHPISEVVFSGKMPGSVRVEGVGHACWHASPHWASRSAERLNEVADCLFSRLTGDRNFINNYRSACYPNALTALKDLSLVSVNFARKRVGLSEVDVVGHIARPRTVKGEPPHPT